MELIRRNFVYNKTPVPGMSERQSYSSVVTRDLDTKCLSASVSAWKKLACTKNRAENVHYLTRLSISSGKQPDSFAVAK